MPAVPNPQVGSVYEVALDGHGLMLYDGNADPDLRLRRQSSSVTPPRLATTDTPFSESLDRYAFFNQGDWRAGAGQRWANRERSSGEAFYNSVGVDPSSVDGLKPVRKLSSVLTMPASITGMIPLRPLSTLTTSLVVSTVTSGRLDVVDATSAAAWSITRTFTAGAWGTVRAMATGAGYLFFRGDNGAIYRYDGTATAPALLIASSVSSQLLNGGLGFVGDRLAVARYLGSNQLAWSTYTTSGTEEVPGGRLVLTVGQQFSWAVSDTVEVAGHAYFVVRDPGFNSKVYCWPIGSTETPRVVFEFWGTTTAIAGVGGNLIIQASPNLYRCVVQADGNLTATIVTEESISFTAPTTHGMADDGRRVFIAGALSTAPPGLTVAPGSFLRALDLETGAWTNWGYTGATGGIACTANFTGTPIAVGAVIYARNGDNEPDVLVGELLTSYTDFASLIPKRWDDLYVSFDPGSAPTSKVVVTLLGGDGTTVALGSVTRKGTTRFLVPRTFATQSEVAIRFRLESGVTNSFGQTSPQIRSFQLRGHALPPVDRVIQLPVDCGDQVAALNGQPVPESGPGAGAARRAALEALVGGTYAFQDRDWHLTGQVSYWDVEAVQAEEWHAPDRTNSRPGTRSIAVVSLRAAVGTTATNPAEPTVPDAPATVEAVRGNAQATVSWTAPANDGGSAVTGYRVTPYNSSGTPLTPVTVGAVLTTAVTGLTNGSQYTFTVEAINAVGTGPAATSNAVIPATVPSAPTIGTATAGIQSATVGFNIGTTGGSPVLSWTATSNPGGHTGTITSTAQAPIPVAGLTAGVSYTFTVTATNELGTSPPSAASNAVTPTALTAPGAPTISGIVGNPGSTEGIVGGWNAPASDGGSAILDYTATLYRTSDNAVIGTETVTGLDALWTAAEHGLVRGTQYYFKVAARNAIGTGPQSVASANRTHAVKPGRPATASSSSGPGAGEITVSWTAPTDDGGQPVTGYRIETYVGVEGGWNFVSADDVGLVLTFIKTGLTSGSTYYFSVKATNVEGTGSGRLTSTLVAP